ncbi:MAG: TonB-dependent receptor domain-containing protein [Vicinamibacteria bacterium]
MTSKTLHPPASRPALQWAVFLCFLAGAEAGAAEITGSIAGVVKDSSGVALAGATVTVRGGSLPAEGRPATVSPSGVYRIALLQPGRYDVDVRLQGFGTQVKKGVEVFLDLEMRLDFVLKPATIEEVVEVVGEAPLVDVGKSEVSTLINERAIDSLPLNGRDFVDLVRLVPGATPVTGGAPGGDLTGVSIFGERAAALSFLVDGADNNNPLNGGPFVRYTQDSIKEFEVITTGYEAQYGRAQGGVTNIVTRSGSNDFQASAFAFGRNDALDSSNIPNQDAPKLERYQWGGSLGGPIRRDKAYFFGTFEVLSEDRGVNIDRSKIPDFVASGLATPGGKEDFGIAPHTHRLNGMVKFDVNLGPRQRLLIQANRSDQDDSGEISSPVLGTIALPSAASASTETANTGTIRHTAFLSSSTFLESAVAYQKGRLGDNLDRPGRFEPILILLASGFQQTGAPFDGKQDRTSKRFQLGQNLTWNQAGWGGEHELKAGWDFSDTGVTGFNNVVNDVEYSAAFLSPDAVAINAERFATLGFAQSAARFFLTLPEVGKTLNLDMTDRSYGGYLQDTWKAGGGVTLNLGVRYDRSSLFGDDNDNVAPRLGATWDIGQKGKTLLRANWGRFYDRNLLTAAATVPEKGGIFTRSAFDVALPRLGSDYTDSLIDLVITSGFPTGSGGRGPAENPTYLGFANDLRQDPLALYKLLGIPVSNPAVPPVVNAANIQQLSGLTPQQAVALLEKKYPGTDFEFFDVPGGSTVGNQVLSFFPRGPLNVTREVSRYSGDQTPSTDALNVGFEQQLFTDVGASVTYVHRRSKDLLTRRIVNLSPAQPGDPNFGKTTDGGPRINEVTYEGRIEYDGVTVAVRKRYSHKYAFLVAYTYSNNKDNLLTGDVGSTFSDNNDPGKDFGPSNQSVPHTLVASGLVELPWTFRLSGIYTIRSGLAFSPRGLKDLDGDGLVDQRDTTVPRNGFRTKPYAAFDARLEKVFKIRGRHSLSALVEGFNLVNRDNVKNITNVAGDQFGTPTEYFPGREIQIGVRYNFGS